jgi:hypothetical protein
MNLLESLSWVGNPVHLSIIHLVPRGRSLVWSQQIAWTSKMIWICDSISRLVTWIQSTRECWGTIGSWPSFQESCSLKLSLFLISLFRWIIYTYNTLNFIQKSPSTTALITPCTTVEDLARGKAATGTVGSHYLLFQLMKVSGFYKRRRARRA